MPTTNEMTKPKGLFALFKGAPNTAKSGAALSFPDPFIWDFDRKMPSVGLKHYPGKNFTWETPEDVFEVSDTMSKFLENGCPHETIIVDTVTSLSTICLKSVDKTKGTSVIKMMGNLVDPRKKGTNDASVEVMGFDYYNAEANFFERYFMDNLQILWSRPLSETNKLRHVIVIAHEITVESAPDLRTKLITRSKTIVTAGRKVAAFIPKSFNDEFVFVVERPMMGMEGKAKRLCVTSIDEDEDARSSYNFPSKIDFTNRSLYDELNKFAKWS